MIDNPGPTSGLTSQRFTRLAETDRPRVRIVIDGHGVDALAGDTLMVAVLMLCGIGLTIMYSAGYDFGNRFTDHARNMGLAFLVLFVVAQISPQQLMRLAVPIYTIGVALLIATAVFGITKKGATR